MQSFPSPLATGTAGAAIPHAADAPFGAFLLVLDAGSRAPACYTSFADVLRGDAANPLQDDERDCCNWYTGSEGWPLNLPAVRQWWLFPRLGHLEGTSR